MDENTCHQLQSLLWDAIQVRNTAWQDDPYDEGWRQAATEIIDIIRTRLGLPEETDDELYQAVAVNATCNGSEDREDSGGTVDSGGGEDTVNTESSMDTQAGPYVYDDNGIQVLVLRSRGRTKQQRSRRKAGPGI